MRIKIVVIRALMELWITKIIVILKADRIKNVNVIEKNADRSKKLTISFELRNKRLERLFGNKFIPFSGYSSIVKQIRNLYYGPEMIEGFFKDYAKVYVMWTRHDENDYLKTMKYLKNEKYLIVSELEKTEGATFFLKFEIFSSDKKDKYFSSTQQIMTAKVLPGFNQQIVNPRKIVTLKKFLSL